MNKYLNLSKNTKIRSAFFLALLFVALINVAKVIGIGTYEWAGFVDPVIAISDARDSNVKSLGCRDDQRYISVIGKRDSEYIACTYDNSFFHLSFSNSDHNFISFTGDSSYYETDFGASFNNISGNVLIPGTDTSIISRSLGWLGRSLSIYKDTSARFTKQQGGISYIWNSINPNYILVNEQNQQIPVRSVGYSENGKWIAAEGLDTGIILINVDTYETKLVSKFIASYGVGRDPMVELTVSNDGKHIAIGGSNTSFSVISISDGCGNYVTDAALSSETLSNPCPEKKLESLVQQKIGINSSLFIRGLRFDTDSTRLDALLTLNNNQKPGGGYKSVVLTAPNYTLGPLINYLALGDSYSSGEGDTEKGRDGKKFYRASTDSNGDSNNPKEKCHISTRSYPYILGNSMNLGAPLTMPSTKWQSVACSAASVWDMKQQGSLAYLGQSDRLKNYNSPNLKAVALNEFIPGRQKQIEFVKKYKPNAITLTAGGNDIGFGEKMKACALSFDTCVYATEEGRKRLARQISDQYDNLKSFYTEVFESSERVSKVYAVSYPQFINGDINAECADKNLFNLNGEEREMVGKSITYMNNTIRQAAIAAGIKYVDIEDVLSGHKLCDAGKKYVTGITNVLGLNGNEIVESFHPNSMGHNEMASGILGRLNGSDLQSYTWCNEGAVQCADPSATKTAIETPPYFSEKENHQKVVYKKFADEEQRAGSEIALVVEPFMFAPNSNVKPSVQSANTLLPNVQTTNLGAVDLASQLPTNITPGLHTILLEGSSYSGEPIGLEQVVLIKSSDPNDVDGDNIIDASDKCLFITPINKDQDIDGTDDACDPYIDDAPIVTPSPSPSPTPSPTPTPGSGTGSINPLDMLIKAIKKVFIVVVKIIISFMQLFRLF